MVDIITDQASSFLGGNGLEERVYTFFSPKYHCLKPEKWHVLAVLRATGAQLCCGGCLVKSGVVALKHAMPSGEASPQPPSAPG